MDKTILELKDGINKLLLWTLRSVREDNGFSAGFSISPKNYGWQGSYPETTGYFIETLSKLNFNKNNIQDKAVEWLLKIQNGNGSFPDFELKGEKIFDSAQIIFGLYEYYLKNKKNEKFLQSIENITNWLIGVQNKNGSWNEKNEPEKSYHSRVAWAITKSYLLTKNEKYKISAKKYINYFESLINDNLFIEKSNFEGDKYSVLHTIIYSIRGFFETSIILNDKKNINLSKKIINKLMNIFEKEKMIYSYYNSEWQYESKDLCPTGMAQFSTLLFRYYEEFKDERAYMIGNKINYKLLKLINKKNPLRPNYSISGSYPISGKYMKFFFPNWAVKFTLDSFQLQIKIINSTREEIVQKNKFNYFYRIFPETIKKEDIRIKLLINELKKTRNNKILDIGCGTGRFVKYVKKYSREIKGVDVSKQLINVAKKNNPSIEFKVGNFNKLPFKNNSFDIVYIIEALQHSSNIQLAFKEINRIIKKSGKIIIIDRNKNSIDGIMKPFKENMNLWFYKKDDFTKEQWYSKKEWRNILNRSGFKLTKLKSFNVNIFSRFYFIVGEKRK